MDIVLSAAEARVLGSLLEKERTVPATYPLTMKALISACNQTSSRDPLMDLSEAEVEVAVDALKAHKLVRKVLPSHGNRSVKYRQVAVDVLTVDEAQRAVLTVLLLRGPQTPQELKTRTERLHPFADAAAVEAVLDDMARWGDPLVRLLPRRPGQRDARWAHLLSGEPDLAAPGPAPARSVPDPAASASAVPAVEPVHGVLGGLAGVWAGADGERLEVVPVAGRPCLAWQGVQEVGFLRLVGSDEVELVLATAAGVVEISTGLVDGSAGSGSGPGSGPGSGEAPEGASGPASGAVEVVLSSDTVATTPTAPDDVRVAVERTIRLAGGALAVTVARPGVGPVTATFTRS